jgi:hypothetical protein
MTGKEIDNIITRLKIGRAEWHDLREAVHDAIAQAVASKQAEIDMLRGVGCEEEGDGPCGVCVKCHVKQAVAAEREACARICDDRACARSHLGPGDALRTENQLIANAIRARTKPS